MIGNLRKYHVKTRIIIVLINIVFISLASLQSSLKFIHLVELYSNFPKLILGYNPNGIGGLTDLAFDLISILGSVQTRIL
jgi:hypothetical protein